MDYAMLIRLQIQSMTDQENYRKLPAILVGASAAALPEQLAIWSYPLQNSDADQASFNMVTAMLCRIHQSGRLDSLSTDAGRQVAEGIRIYKEVLRQHIPEAVPFYPSERAHMTNPIASGRSLVCALQCRFCLESGDSMVPQRRESPGHNQNPGSCIRAILELRLRHYKEVCRSNFRGAAWLAYLLVKAPVAIFVNAKSMFGSSRKFPMIHFAPLSDQL